MATEQEFVITEGLTRGIRRFSENPRNSQEFTTFKNIQPLEWGAKEYSILTDGGSGGGGVTLLGAGTTGVAPAFAWPWPQLFRGKNELIMALNQELYKPAFDGSSWTTNLVGTDELSVWQALDITSAYTIPSSSGSDGIWHFVDFGEVWGLVRPAGTIFYTKTRLTSTGVADVIQGQHAITMRTACAHKGRAITGGFDNANFWGSDWKYIWREWAVQQNIGVDFDFTEVHQNWVMWTAPNSPDIAWIFKADYAYNPSGVIASYTEQTTPSEPLLFQSLKRGDMGMMPMSWNGQVQIVKSLGDNVMVYGTNGISALVPSNVEGSPYGEMSIMKQVGIHGRGAVGGNEKEQIFIDELGTLWRIDDSLKLERLGYKELFTGSDVWYISLDELENFYYISNGSLSYILTRTGMMSTHQKVSAVFHEVNKLCASVSTPSGGTDNDAILVTDILDFGTRALKEIKWVEIGGITDEASALTVQIDYRFDTFTSFTSSTAHTVSNTGISPNTVSGSDFRIRITADDHSKLQGIDYIKVRWARVDDRHIRGLVGRQ